MLFLQLNNTKNFKIWKIVKFCQTFVWMSNDLSWSLKSFKKETGSNPARWTPAWSSLLLARGLACLARFVPFRSLFLLPWLGPSSRLGSAYFARTQPRLRPCEASPCPSHPTTRRRPANLASRDRPSVTATTARHAIKAEILPFRLSSFIVSIYLS